jgi:CRISPR-associated protein Cas2
MSGFWMVTYDIVDDGIRREVYNILKNYGIRVQYSVFECWLNESQLAALRNQLIKLIEPKDSLRWYPLCKWCRNGVYWQGQGKPATDDGFILA